MIESKDAITIILKKFPGFGPVWDDDVEYYSRGVDVFIPGINSSLSLFGSYIITKIKENPRDEILLRDAFNLIETFATEGDDDLQTAATTGFLERLSNATPDDISGRDFAHYLGPESKAYLKAYDDWCGVKMDGLWDDS